MRYVGRIISQTKIDGLSDFIDVTKDHSSISGNEAKIPTLIVGYKNAVDICGKINILNKKIGNNLYWTFSKRERRMDYEPDLQNFITTVSNFVMKYCTYEYVDVLTCGKDKESDIRSKLSDGSKRKVVYETDTMYYVYIPSESKIFGFSKELLKFSGKDGVLNIVEQPSTVVCDSNFTERNISKSKFVLPLLYYLKSF